MLIRNSRTVVFDVESIIQFAHGNGYISPAVFDGISEEILEQLTHLTLISQDFPFGFCHKRCVGGLDVQPAIFDSSFEIDRSCLMDVISGLCEPEKVTDQLFHPTECLFSIVEMLAVTFITSEFHSAFRDV